MHKSLDDLRCIINLILDSLAHKFKLFTKGHLQLLVPVNDNVLFVNDPGYNN